MEEPIKDLDVIFSFRMPAEKMQEGDKTVEEFKEDLEHLRVEMSQTAPDGITWSLEVRDAVEFTDKQILDWMEEMRADCEGHVLTRCFIPSERTLREQVADLMRYERHPAPKP